MANYTTKAILHHFEQMLVEMPFEKITVSALVERCEISSNTFYYHFRDIYDLLDAWLNEQKKSFLKEVDGIEGWAARLKVALKMVRENAAVTYHIFDSFSRERIEHFVFVVLEKEFYLTLKDSLRDSNISEESLRDLSSFCCYSTFGFFLKFLWDRMEVDVDEAVDRLSRTFYGVIEHVAARDASHPLPRDPEKI